MPLFDSTGRDLERVFELTPSNKGSFETALRRALATFLGDHVSLAGARMVFIRDAPGFIAAVKSLRPRRLIYYGHAILETKVLLPSLGKSITTWQLLNALKGSGVQDFDILGCSGSGIAAELSIDLQKVRIGYLRNKRQDNVEADPITSRVKQLKIDRQPLYHFPPSSQ